MRKPRFLPALPGLPGPSLPVIVLSFPAAWQSPGAGTADSGLLHPHHPPGLSGEAEAQECPVCAHGAGQERCHHMGEGHHGAARGTGESCPGLPWESLLKVRRQNLHSEGRGAEPCSVPSCCPARAQWQVSPLSCPCLVPAVPLGGHGAPERAQLSLHSAGSVQGVTAQLLLAYAGSELCPLSPETQCPSLEVTWELPALCRGGGREGTLCDAFCTLQGTSALGLWGSVSS